MSILMVYLCNLGLSNLNCSACELDFLKLSGENQQVQRKSRALKSYSLRRSRPKLYHIMSILLVYLCNLGRTDLNCSACDLDFQKSSGESP